jgi:hypothetical protein
MSTLTRVFQANGEAVFPIGGQTQNSSGYNAREFTHAFDALDTLHGNTLEVPVYWEQIEPEEGAYDFASVDALVEQARQRDVHLILLWFGTWKNGNMEYAPDWVKTDPDRFKRVISPAGLPLWVLSSHCEATITADRAAFCALCRHLRETDGTRGTVLALQIENEPGILGSDRDYGADAEAVFTDDVPEALMAKVREADSGPLFELWQHVGKREGTWARVFGPDAGEIMTAWSIARTIDRIAEAGKAVYDIPMYLNVWLGENGWRIPGESYPSGGAVTKVLDLYLWATPHVDLIAPDIYIADAAGYTGVCETYARADNPLFVPESAPGGSNAWNLFRAVADYDAIGYLFFAIERILDDEGQIRPGAQQLVDSFRALAAVTPLLLEHQGTGRIHAVVQEENLGAQIFEFEGHDGMVQFGVGPMPRAGKDWRHPSASIPVPASVRNQRGRGLIVQTGRHEFYLVGADYRLFLRPKRAPKAALDTQYTNDRLRTRLAHYVRVDEGHFDADGTFVVDRRRNGDETDHGIWVEGDVGVVHVVLCP